MRTSRNMIEPPLNPCFCGGGKGAKEDRIQSLAAPLQIGNSVSEAATVFLSRIETQSLARKIRAAPLAPHAQHLAFIGFLYISWIVCTGK